MNVVLDTNILFSDFHLMGAKITVLCTSIDVINGCVCIPEIVIRETVRKFGDELTEAQKKADKALDDYARISKMPVYANPITDAKIKTLIADYEKYLRSRIDKLGIEVLPIPTTPHEELVSRDLAIKKPFSRKGTGYRDALIWENVKSVCQSSEGLFDKPRAVFVNKNTKDFCAEGYELHDDLKENLIESGADSDSVKIVGDIDNFIDEYIKPKQKILQKIIDKLNKVGAFKEIDLFAALDDVMADKLMLREFDDDESPFGGSYENPIVTSYDPPKYTVNDVREISDDEVVIEMNVEVECEFTFYMLKSEACLRDDDDLHITHHDWNRHYVEATQSATVNLNVTLLVDKAFQKVSSSDIGIVEPEFMD